MIAAEPTGTEKKNLSKVNNGKDGDDEEEEEEDDEDYNPNHDDKNDNDADRDTPVESDDVIMADDTAEDETTLLAPAQKRAVDQAFQELFGYSWGTNFELPTARRQRRVNANTTATTITTTTILSPYERLLIQILGPVRAAKVLQAGPSFQLHRSRRKSMAAGTAKAKTKTKMLGEKSSAPATTTTSLPVPPKPQYETKLFAGQKIQVATNTKKEKNVPKSAASAAASAAAATTTTASSSGNIDSVLQQLEGPAKLSTVAKTSMDWDSFKTTTGLESALEQKANSKDAFLIKQDFLTRVDQRKFDLERTDREKERAKRKP